MLKNEVGQLTRLSSLEPPDVNTRLVEVIAASTEEATFSCISALVRTMLRLLVWARGV